MQCFSESKFPSIPTPHVRPDVTVQHSFHYLPPLLLCLRICYQTNDCMMKPTFSLCLLVWNKHGQNLWQMCIGLQQWIERLILVLFRVPLQKKWAGIVYSIWLRIDLLGSQNILEFYFNSTFMTYQRIIYHKPELEQTSQLDITQ